MEYPDKLPLSKPCPTCNHALYRKTVDPEKPFGMVVCSDCAFTSTMLDFVNNIRAERMQYVQNLKKSYEK